MSSSAAIEGGLAYALDDLFALGTPRLDLVKLAQRAENDYVGVQCGIMDQFVNFFGEERRVVKLDCRTLEYEYLPFARNDIRVVLCDTQVRRSLATSAYNDRRKECERGVASIRTCSPEVRSLRDVTPAMLAAQRNGLDPVIERRCRFVVEENARVLAGCDDLRTDNIRAFGEKMYASHEGLRDLYEVSSAELDALVEIARDVPGVFGSRMMGAGFGGCTINLVEEDSVARFGEVARDQYRKRLGREIKIYINTLRSGTSKISAEQINV